MIEADVVPRKVINLHVHHWPMQCYQIQHAHVSMSVSPSLYKFIYPPKVKFLFSTQFRKKKVFPTKWSRQYIPTCIVRSLRRCPNPTSVSALLWWVELGACLWAKPIGRSSLLREVECSACWCPNPTWSSCCRFIFWIVLYLVWVFMFFV
jgi:hypothetical protein